MVTPGPNRPEQAHVSINEHDVVVQRSSEVQGGRFLQTGDEAGTAPEDLVIPHLPGGGIGVDVENPIRHSRLLTQNPPLSVVMGLILIAACLGIVTLIAEVT